MLKIGIFGLTGRMGQAILHAIYPKKKKEISVIGGTGRHAVDAFSTTIEQENYQFHMASVDEIAQQADVCIDFSVASMVRQHLEACVRHQTALVIGTTGFDDIILDQIVQAGEKIAVLQSGNMSLGVNLLSLLVQKTASILSDDWDIEISEAHHHHKIDSPSGTALMLGESAAKGRDVVLKDVQAINRNGKRNQGDIGFSVIRAGSIIGDHHVLFAHDDEHLTLSHHARNRGIFASGAVYAAEKLAQKPNGFYHMKDILDIPL